ncbi:MAG: hypothetical protein MRERC_2c116 [Mycoplasmataceae bacterium RC_NB112A]|nr:MAG: hypothetical protein MRERC_2c116 [Mycoplasmataceae bacterium RC_NB112A]
MEWIKVPLNLKESDSWDKYKERLREILRNLNIDEKELSGSSIGRLIDYIDKVIDKKKEKKTINETQKGQIEKYQEKIYREIILKVEEKEWIEQVNKKIPKDESSPLVVLKERGSHTRSSSLPPRLNLLNAKNGEEGSFKKFFLDYHDEEAKIKQEEEEINKKEIEVQGSQVKKISYEQLEKKIHYLELDKKIEEREKEIFDYKKLMKDNSRVAQELVKKGIIAADDIYLNNNFKIERKINEYQEEVKKLKSQLEILEKELETQIQISPKNN